MLTGKPPARRHKPVHPLQMHFWLRTCWGRGMRTAPPKPDPDPGAQHAEVISQNIEAIQAFYNREQEKMTPSQRVLEHISAFLGQPRYLVSLLVFTLLWVLGNLAGRALGHRVLDPPPFNGLQNLVSLAALLTATVVLINQNRLGRVEEARAHLDLQVNLLSEQKITKLISLMEELRRDLPSVADREDREASAFQHPTDPNAVLTSLQERREPKLP